MKQLSIPPSLSWPWGGHEAVLLVDFWLVTEVTDKVTSYPGASVLSLFFILIGVYGQVEAYCLQLCVHGDTTLEVAFVAYFFFFNHLGFSTESSTQQRKNGIFLKAERLSSSSLHLQHLILFMLVAQLPLTLYNPMNC